MEACEALVIWAEKHGVKISSIEPRQIPERGMGLVATKPIEVGRTILEVPTAVFRGLESLPKSMAKQLPADVSVHGRLATHVALDRSCQYATWNAVVPRREDIWASMPLAWDSRLHDHLPTTARELVAKQSAHFARDFSLVHEVYSHLDENDYLYAWLLVNSRTFYHVTPRTEALSKHDRMVLQPVADLFNHADRGGCRVTCDGQSFVFQTTEPYSPGDEVHISYGCHSNDFLLVEYGFILGENCWDEVCLDDAILPALCSWQKEELQGRGYLGAFMLDADAICHRTQVAVRIMCVPLGQWREFADGLDDGAAQQDEVDSKLVTLLKKYESSARDRLRKLDASVMRKVGQAEQRAVLRSRWGQILKLVTKRIQGLEG